MITPTANADPPPWQNPHYPDYEMNHCPGGSGGFIIYWCDGEHYPDGSYWHQRGGDRGSGGGETTPQCVILPSGATSPVPAPPSGCDGYAGG